MAAPLALFGTVVVNGLARPSFADPSSLPGRFHISLEKLSLSHGCTRNEWKSLRLILSPLLAFLAVEVALVDDGTD